MVCFLIFKVLIFLHEGQGRCSEMDMNYLLSKNTLLPTDNV